MYSETILIVDDEAGLAQMLEMMLRKEGFQSVVTVLTGQEGLNFVQTSHVDLILLDVMLPDISGFELCREMRQETQAPIIFLTARVGDYDKLAGLAIGGDDYITKPFSPLEVVARIQAHLRRHRMHQSVVGISGKCTNFGRLRIYEDEGRVEIDGVVVPLTAKVFEVTYLLFMFVGLLNGVEVFDFMGSISTTVQRGQFMVYFEITIILLPFIYWGRSRKLR